MNGEVHTVNYFGEPSDECFCKGKHNPLTAEPRFVPSAPSSGEGYCSLSRRREGLFWGAMRGAPLLQEPVITPAISVTLSLSFKIAAGLHLE